MLIGYARVSTTDQDTEMQLTALRRAGCEIFYAEKTSSVGKRLELQRCLNSLQAGDKLLVYKLDRLARSLKDLLNIIERLELAGAGFQSVTESIDTHSPSGRLMLQMLGAVAEFERSLIRERSMHGQRLARDRGVKFGRKRNLGADIEAKVIGQYENGYTTMNELAREHGVHVSTIKRTIYRKLKPDSSSLL
ncbi:MAG: recombinase family protein [Betaproteobacteria bacterium]|nr:MAG: recombinase family protein [Betaproteobacteria bacterium]